MNMVNKASKAIRELRVAIGGCRSDDAKMKIRRMIGDLYSEVMPIEAPVEIGAVVGAGGAEVPKEPEVAPKAVETPKEVILTPVSDHEVEMGGVPDGAHPEITHKPVENTVFVEGWPMEAEIEIWTLSPNRRMFRGKLGEKWVSVERNAKIKPGMRVRGKLLQAGAHPLFRAVV